ncbi:DMT family transporter [uncultured Alcanivorax sp.]|jgi:drug/metabolite transporter (DMT)-like permease|uniref:DMT family transporter n=1 Tax=uncultured Alcanivorax sp. TaxID=191215 RepID=UPI0025FF3045|nr:DMT family transporter [uncultured Alcanivorax sp.]
MGGALIPAQRTLVLTALAMVAFAANSVLCRLALREGAIDAASFTAVRLVSGAVALGLILLLRDRSVKAMATQGNQGSALALFVYAAGFSLAYVELATGTGALLLFGAVQATMIGIGLYRGERLAPLQWLGLMLALAGLVALMLPGATAPPLAAAALMLVAGAAWGVYSLRGKGAADATAVTAGNFLRALIWLLPLALFAWPAQWPQGAGLVYAVLSGALASGAGYAIWYLALRGLVSSTAATVQLSVPVLAALAGVLWLDEAFTLRLLLASAAILGGIALVIRRGASR